jgi:diketogulonate reductase-like aldo/keto reductase
LGLAKAIGVSNFSVERIEEMLPYAKIIPAVNQVEMHPLWQQSKLRAYCKEKGILLSAYSPLGAAGNAHGTNDVITNPTISEIAVKYGKTPAQVILQWVLGKGVSCIVRSYNRGRQLENFESQGWKLVDADIQTIDGLSNQKRYLDPDSFIDPVHGPFKTKKELWGEE